MSSYKKRAAIAIGLAFCLTQAAFSADEKKTEEKKEEGPALKMGASPSMLANTCAGCHGPDGASGGPATPTIAGISSEYFIETMEDFKEGDIPSTIMGRIAAGYSDEEIEQMGEYFAKLPFVPADGQKFDTAMAKKGAKLHDKYCEKCHADGGTSAEDDSGILAGQWQPYLHYSLMDFNAGDRKPPKKMARKLKKLMEKEGEEGVTALLNFYAK